MDGEVIAADETGRPQFYDLLRCARKPAYVAFDLLWPDGVDLRSLPLSERRRRLQGIISKDSPAIAEVLSVRGRGRQLFELMHSYDLEGIVAKRLMIRTTRSSAGSKAHRAAEAAADLECRFDDGVAREAGGTGSKYVTLRGRLRRAIPYPPPRVECGAHDVQPYMGRNGPAGMRIASQAGKAPA